MHEKASLFVVVKILSDLGHTQTLKKLQKDANDKTLSVDNIPVGIKNFNFEALVAGLTTEVPIRQPKRSTVDIEFVKAKDTEVKETPVTESTPRRDTDQDETSLRVKKQKKVEKASKTAKKQESPETKTAVKSIETSELTTEKKVAKKDKKKNTEEATKEIIAEVPTGRFKRIQDDVWMQRIEKDELKENSFTMKNDEFSLKAAQELMKVKGKNFRTEKMKKKRSSWKGSGEISTQVNSIKFDDSDSESD